MAAGSVNSNLIIAGQGAKSTMPGTLTPVSGSIVIPLNTSFSTADKLNLFQMSGADGYINGGWIDFPALDAGSGLTFKLWDGTNTFFTGNTVAQAGGFVTLIGAATVSQHGFFGQGTLYTTTTTIILVPTHTSTNTTGASALTIYFNFEIGQN